MMKMRARGLRPPFRAAARNEGRSRSYCGFVVLFSLLFNLNTSIFFQIIKLNKLKNAYRLYLGTYLKK